MNKNIWLAAGLLLAVLVATVAFYRVSEHLPAQVADFVGRVDGKLLLSAAVLVLLGNIALGLYSLLVNPSPRRMFVRMAAYLMWIGTLSAIAPYGLCLREASGVVRGMQHDEHGRAQAFNGNGAAPRDGLGEGPTEAEARIDFGDCSPGSISLCIVILIIVGLGWICVRYERLVKWEHEEDFGLH